MLSNCTNMAHRAGVGIFASLALAAAGAVAPSAFGQCGNIAAGSTEAQIGIQGGGTQECNFDDCWDLNGNARCDLETEDIDGDGDCDAADCDWTGLAFPIDVVGGLPCPADLDGPQGVPDGDVGVPDLLVLLGAWGPCDKPCPPTCPADFDGPQGVPDCEVGVPDLLFLLGNWGPCP